MPDTPSQAAYRTFCATAPDVPLFAQPWYLEACAEGGHWDAVLAHDQHDQHNRGRAVAALPFFVKRTGPFRHITMPPFLKWLGPYLLPELRGKLKLEHAILRQLIEQLPPLAAFRQNCYPTLTNWLPFYWAGFQQTTYYTYRLPDLQNLAAHAANLSRNLRRDIAAARRQVEVVHDLGPDVFWEINALSFARQGLPLPYARAAFNRLDAALAAHGARHFFFARDAQGRVHSVVYLVWDAHTAYYHLAGDDPALRGSGAGLLLAWEAIRYAAEVLKLNCFDFEGSMLPNVERMRVRFGAVQTPYFFVWKQWSKPFALLQGFKKLIS